MVTKEEIDSYIDKAPPLSEMLKEVISLLNKGELLQAAKVAKKDLALNSYLQHLVNKPIYGFRNEVNDISQIFSILGLSGSQQSVYNYTVNLLSPDSWVLFKLNRSSFNNLQAELSINWKKILLHLNIIDKSIESSIALLPASIIIAEAMFFNKIDDINLLRSNNEIDFNTILQRLCGLDLFDTSEKIANRWGLDSNIALIIQASSGLKSSSNKEINQLGKWMHLLLFYTLSKPTFIEAQLNDFIEFQIDYVSNIYEEFAVIMEIS